MLKEPPDIKLSRDPPSTQTQLLPCLVAGKSSLLASFSSCVQKGWAKSTVPYELGYLQVWNNSIRTALSVNMVQAALPGQRRAESLPSPLTPRTLLSRSQHSDLLTSTDPLVLPLLLGTFHSPPLDPSSIASRSQLQPYLL